MPNDRITPELARTTLPGSLPGNLGIELVSIDDERTIGRMEVDARHLHPGGYVHGGAWATFADTVAAWGTMHALEPDVSFTTVELKTNVFAAGRAGDVLIGVGEALHAGGRTQVWEVRIRREADERLMANFVCTQIVLAG